MHGNRLAGVIYENRLVPHEHTIPHRLQRVGLDVLAGAALLEAVANPLSRVVFRPALLKRHAVLLALAEDDGPVQFGARDLGMGRERKAPHLQRRLVHG
jgi:hypothetical protein